jgi:uncharacterized protein (TIGR01777 family)
MRIAVVGATGLLGRRLVAALAARGDTVLAVSRRGAPIERASAVAWDPAWGPPPRAMLDGVDAVVNLAGAPVGDGRWTAARKRAIVDSRVETTRQLVEALGGDGVPRILVNASGVDYYRPSEQPIDESGPPGRGFLAEVCVAWEREALRAESRGVRVVVARTGMVLAAEGGALPQLARVTRLGVMGPLAGGRQWVSWVHVDDHIGLLQLALDRDDLAGPINSVSPRPVHQREMARALGRVLGRPALIPAPGIAVRLALGEMADLLVDSHRIMPAGALRAGYAFCFDALEPALADALA